MTEIISVSYSELRSIKRCFLQHRIGYVDGWRKEHGPTSALSFGTAWHEVLNAYYSVLQHTNGGAYSASPFRAAMEVLRQQPEEVQEHLEMMLTAYSAHYGVEPGWKPVAVEWEFFVELPQLKPDLRVILHGFIDLVIVDLRTKGVWIDDHKTCTAFPSQRGTVDPQLPLYCWAWKKNRRQDVMGARYSYARKPTRKTSAYPDDPEKRFCRRLVPHSVKELQEAANDAYKTAYIAYRSPFLDQPPRTVEPSCEGYCDFAEPCRASRKGYPLQQFLKDYGLNRTLAEPKAPRETASHDSGPHLAGD